ncbi:MAG: M1 family metallopeptidase [Acidimicrobiales bacterium]
MTTAATQGEGDARAEEGRLPRGASPRRYELLIDPDLQGGAFRGEETIELEVHERLDELVCNSVGLEIGSARLEPVGEGEGAAPRVGAAADGAAGPGGVGAGGAIEAEVVLEPGEERVRFRLARAVGPGRYRLSATFSGSLSERLAGFYRSRFTAADGTEALLGVTQFEATDARRAFPCWDEPDRKAVFSVSLVVGEGQEAVSNGPEVGREERADGRRKVCFADTMPMSTYLVAFVVGPLRATEALDVDGVPLRVVHVPGRERLTAFALEAGAHALRFFAEWFGIPYPGEKLDLLAVPDFAFGAMENLGAVTFRESVLLVDPESASRTELERVADVVSHEIAHMWFGDLVTMAWWDGTWLNEAFATFMEVLCVDHFRPQWRRWVGFGRDRADALVTDGLSSTRPIEYPVHKPSDAEGMFDVLTYEKGASVLRMLERYLGPERFRAGINRYLETHRHANATTGELWEALEATTGEPVRAVMNGWILQGGHPLLRVSAQGSTLALEQEPFAYRQDAERGAIGRDWSVPAVVKIGLAGETVERRLLLPPEGIRVELPSPALWVNANAGGTGVYRTLYEGDLLGLGAARLAELEDAERAAFVAECWAVTLAGRSPLAGFVGLLGEVGEVAEPTLLGHVITALDLLDRVADDSQRPALAETVRRLLHPPLRHIGLERDPGEGPLTGSARGALVGALGTLGEDPGLVAWCQELHDSYLAGRSPLDGDLARAVLCNVASCGDEETYETFLARSRAATDPQEELRYLYSLAYFEHPDLLARTLDLALSEVRSQNSPFLLRACLAGRGNGVATWDFIETHWAAVRRRIPANTVRTLIGGLAAHSSAALATRARPFMDAHPLPHAARQVAQALELLDVNVAFAAREGPRLAATLAPGGQQ